MKEYYRVMLGKKSVYFDEAFSGGFIGGDFDIDKDLSDSLFDDWRPFNKIFIPIYLEKNPEKSKVAAGLACGFLWTIAKGIAVGDIVLCPDGSGAYAVGEVVSDYEYKKDTDLPHRRHVKWYPNKINRSDMSQDLKYSTGSIGTISRISKYAQEIEKLIGGDVPQVIYSNDESVEDPTVFALEKHLEDFLVQNWQYTELGKRYDIYEEDGELIGQQYQSDTGPIDILAISKDKGEILVIELKKGRASDVVVGQIQRYMGYVQDELAEKNQKVRGTIIAFEDDLKLQRALSVTQNIDLYTYKIQFSLEKK